LNDLIIWGGWEGGIFFWGGAAAGREKFFLFFIDHFSFLITQYLHFSLLRINKKG